MTQLEDLVAHAAHAFDAHVRWCAVNAIPVPPIVQAVRGLLRSASASSGQERTEFANAPVDGGESGVLMEGLLAPDQVAHRLHVSSRSVRRLVGSGELPSVKVGGATRFDPVDVEEFIDAKRKVRRSAG
jgi:excisionase family DNA binding protein